MLRLLLYGLAILHLGPGIAFAIVAFGCEALEPLLGSMCQQDTFTVFMQLTLMIWLALTGGLLLKIMFTNYFNKK